VTISPLGPRFCSQQGSQVDFTLWSTNAVFSGEAEGLASGFVPISANLIKALARRMYFVPEGQSDRSHSTRYRLLMALEFGHFREQNSRHDPRESLVC
jgi:hypothetical protein